MYEGLVESYGTLGLFISSFISSTIAPGGSEAVLSLLILDGQHPVMNLVIIATIGNTLGALTTFYLGTLAASKYPLSKLKEKRYAKANGMITRYGTSSLLLSWLPLIGDALCFVAGWIKLHFWPSLAFILVGKFARYYFLATVLLEIKN